MTDVGKPAGPAGTEGSEGGGRSGGGAGRWGTGLALVWVLATALATGVLLWELPGPESWEPGRRSVEVPFRGVSGLAWDGHALWVTVDGEGKAYRVDPADGAVQGELELPAADTGGSAWDGRTLYQLAYLERRIYLLDPVDGRVRGHLPTPGEGLCSGLTWDGEALWVAAFEEGRLYRVDPASGAVLGRLPAPLQSTGLAWDGSSLWQGVLVGAESHADAPPTGFVRRLGEGGEADRAVPLPGVFAGTSDWLGGDEPARRQWWFDGHHGRLVELSFAGGDPLARSWMLLVTVVLGGLVGLLFLARPRRRSEGPGAGGAGTGDRGTGQDRRGRSTLRLGARGAIFGGMVFLHGLRFAVLAGAWFLRGRPREVPRVAGESLQRLLTAGGAAFIKLGQVLSARPDLLPAAVVEPLRELQDRVPPFPSSKVPGLLEVALGRARARDLAARLEPEPLAAASVAQVYRGRLEDGTAVAVKVRRPGIRRRVADDLALLDTLARGLERLPFLRVVPLGDLVGEVATCVWEQLDLDREVANLERFRTNFAGVERIRLPRPVPELSGEGVLTMELLEDLYRVDDPELPAREKRAAALAGVKALYKMIFLDGFIHADLHPGNVFVRPDGELALVDAGLVAELRGDELDHFVEFFSGMVGNDGRACARVVVETASWLSPHYSAAAFEAAMVDLIERHSSLRAEEFEVSDFAVQLFDTQRRHGVRGSTRFTMTILSLAVFEGIVKQLHPRLDFQSAARPYLIAARYGRVSRAGD